jgi:MarR-like DNA-binding transcriptional regulator SgrR of sgrS sRNA
MRAAVLLSAFLAAGASVPRVGGVARVTFSDVPDEPNPETLPSSSDVFLSTSVFQCLVRPGPDGTILPGLARSWTVSRPQDGAVFRGADAEGPAGSAEGWLRWVFELDPLARFPDGRRVTSEDVIASWQELLTSSRSPYRWLLDPVAGARAYRRGESTWLQGLVAGMGTLEIRLSRPAPDLLHRLAHPALGVRAFRGGKATLVGAGPFDSDAETTGTLIGVNPYHHLGRPFLDGLETVEPQTVDPSLLLESGQTDLAVLYGRSAGQILSSPSSRIKMERIPGWDRVYSLVWNALSDGSTRGGIPLRLRGALDRGAMVRYLFDGRGTPATSLLPSDHALQVQPAVAPPGAPLSGRISLLHDERDLAATSIASRIKASWEQMGLRVELHALDPADLWYRLASGDYLAAVLLHHPPTSDPVLGLQGTLSQLGRIAEPALQKLEDASRHTDPSARSARAHLAENLLLEQGFLVPLVRVHAWLATAPALVGVEGGPAGVLYLEDAWWLPGRGRG